MTWWKFWIKKSIKFPHERLERRNVDTEKIKTRLTHLGWTVKEIPVRQKHAGSGPHEITSWKLIAIREQQSFNVSGPTLDEAFGLLGQTLGVVPRKATT